MRSVKDTISKLCKLVHDLYGGVFMTYTGEFWEWLVCIEVSTSAVVDLRC